MYKRLATFGARGLSQKFQTLSRKMKVVRSKKEGYGLKVIKR